VVIVSLGAGCPRSRFRLIDFSLFLGNATRLQDWVTQFSGLGPGIRNGRNPKSNLRIGN
jgi:hypothetical protein